MKDISSIRKEYKLKNLSESDVLSDPIDQFTIWFGEAMDAEIIEPNAMILATSDPEGSITQRTVLLKAFDKQGFVFYTNYQSRKGKQIDQNPRMCLLFPWYGLERQVAITGKAEKISKTESINYFLARPRGSQMGAWVSNQSQIISSRLVLDERLAHMERKFDNKKIPFPEHWGGYRVYPDSIEFWQGRPSRLHDRLLYSRKNEEKWIIQRLAP